MRRLSICLLVCVLGGCSLFHPDSHYRSADTDDGGLKMACAHDPYLRKFGCSVPKIQQAARSGNADAQYALGYLYFYGIGLSRDSETGLLWIRRAASRGQSLAREALVMISNDQTFGHQPVYSGGGGSSYHQPRADVAQLNAQVPGQPVSAYLPAYHRAAQPVSSGAKKRGQTPNASMPPLSQRKPIKNYAHTDPRLTSKGSINSPYLARKTRSSAHRTRGSKVHHRVGPAPSVKQVSTHLSVAEQGFLKKQASSYTLQLMGSHSLASIHQFIKQHNLSGMVQSYSTSFRGKTWYMLVYGEYGNARLARLALNRLPLSLQNLHPWVKSFKVVQKEIKTRKMVG